MPPITRKSELITGANKPLYKCSCCGREFASQKKNFYRSAFSNFFKANDGFFVICKECTLAWYQLLVQQLGSEDDAIKFFCSAFDIYFNRNVVDFAKRSDKNTCAVYLGKIGIMPYTGKTFLDTLREEAEAEGQLSAEELNLKNTGLSDVVREKDEEIERLKEELQKYEDAERDGTLDASDEVDPDMIKMWGPGYTTEEYNAMSYEYSSWLMGVNDGKEPDFRMQQGLIQLCKINVDIARARASGAYSPVSSLYKQYTDTLKKYGLAADVDDGSTFSEKGLGTMIKMWEETRPVPPAPKSLEDVNGLWKYISIWFTGHLSRMYGLKNKFTKMYDDEINKYKVSSDEDEAYFDIETATQDDEGDIGGGGS